MFFTIFKERQIEREREGKLTLQVDLPPAPEMQTMFLFTTVGNSRAHIRFVMVSTSTRLDRKICMGEKIMLGENHTGMTAKGSLSGASAEIPGTKEQKLYI